MKFRYLMLSAVAATTMLHAEFNQEAFNGYVDKLVSNREEARADLEKIVEAMTKQEQAEHADVMLLYHDTLNMNTIDGPEEEFLDGVRDRLEQALPQLKAIVAMEESPIKPYAAYLLKKVELSLPHLQKGADLTARELGVLSRKAKEELYQRMKPQFGKEQLSDQEFEQYLLDNYQEKAELSEKIVKWALLAEEDIVYFYHPFTYTLRNLKLDEDGNLQVNIEATLKKDGHKVAMKTIWTSLI